MYLDTRVEDTRMTRRNTEKKKDKKNVNGSSLATDILTSKQRSFGVFSRKKGMGNNNMNNSHNVGRFLKALVGVASFFVTGMVGFIFFESKEVMKQTPRQSPSFQNKTKKKSERIAGKGEFSDNAKALKGIQEIREMFYERYGGKEEAMALKERGILTFGKEEEAMKHLSERFLKAAHRKVDFNLSFGGYSVTVGRGNHFSQSYPFVIHRVLNDLVYSIWDIELKVVNAAIGGIPSLPYGWCLRNFFGEDADLVSWDYGMNEGTDITALESYLRHSITLAKQPMFLMLDAKPFRKRLIKTYVDAKAIVDPIAVNRDKLVNNRFLAMPEAQRPEGYKDWDKWGSPPGSPGQNKWHPKYKEHELIGWIIAMHILDGIQVAVNTMINDNHWKSQFDTITPSSIPAMEEVNLPSPVSKPSTDNTIGSLLLGTSHPDDPQSIWHYNHVSCRTSFLPVIHGKMNSIVVSGVSSPDDGDAMASKDDASYQAGWTMDIGHVERTTKRKVEKVGGMGYIDMKLALYGIPESGTLRLWLPYEGMEHDHHHHDTDTQADHWFHTLIICEVNEKRQSQFHECDLKSDLTFVVGGAESKHVEQITTAATYLGKNLCLQVDIPDQAKITKRSDLRTHDNKSLSSNAIESIDSTDDNQVGLIVDIQVSGLDVTRKGGACSISHVIWEQHKDGHHSHSVSRSA